MSSTITHVPKVVELGRNYCFPLTFIQLDRSLPDWIQHSLCYARSKTSTPYYFYRRESKVPLTNYNSTSSEIMNRQFGATLPLSLSLSISLQLLPAMPVQFSSPKYALKNARIAKDVRILLQPTNNATDA